MTEPRTPSGLYERARTWWNAQDYRGKPEEIVESLTRMLEDVRDQGLEIGAATRDDVPRMGHPSPQEQDRWEEWGPGQIGELRYKLGCARGLLMQYAMPPEDQPDDEERQRVIDETAAPLAAGVSPIRPEDETPDAGALRSIAYFLHLWVDGDDAWHSLGHIEQYLRERTGGGQPQEPALGETTTIEHSHGIREQVYAGGGKDDARGVEAGVAQIGREGSEGAPENHATPVLAVREQGSSKPEVAGANPAPSLDSTSVPLTANALSIPLDVRNALVVALGALVRIEAWADDCEGDDVELSLILKEARQAIEKTKPTLDLPVKRMADAKNGNVENTASRYRDALTWIANRTSGGTDDFARARSIALPRRHSRRKRRTPSESRLPDCFSMLTKTFELLSACLEARLRARPDLGSEKVLSDWAEEEGLLVLAKVLRYEQKPSRKASLSEATLRKRARIDATADLRKLRAMELLRTSSPKLRSKISPHPHRAG